MSNFFYRWDDLQKLKQGEMVLPNFVDVHLSYICNQHCLGCAFNEGRISDMMSRDKFVQAAGTLMDNGVKSFAFCGGGEPCTVPYLSEAWRYIAGRKAHFALLSNGSLFTQEDMETLIDKGTFVRVSLEASNAEDYAIYKGVSPDVWNRVIKNVKRLVAIKREKGSQCSVGIKFAVCKSLRGASHYTDGILLGEALGVDRVTFRSIRAMDEELDHDESVFEKRLLADELDRLRPKSRIAQSIVKSDFSRVPQCWLNPIHTVMDWRGDLFICCYYYFRRDTHRLGNIFEDDFRTMWFSQKHRDLIKQIKRTECAKVDCKFFAYHDEFAETDKVGSLYLL
jgi:radical SAM protein with 4Fe4S-binding SPASM domain